MSKKSRNVGNNFQNSIESSCKESGIFFHNIKDVFIPAHLRGSIMLPKNKYDIILFYKGTLFPMELKTTDKKSFSMSSVQPHQLQGLQEATNFNGVKPGMLINFRGIEENPTFFIPINKFITYKKFALDNYEAIREGKIENPYIDKINRASIPFSICKRIGIKVDSSLKRVNYRYDMQSLLEVAIHYQDD